jgi:hypothetical protein
MPASIPRLFTVSRRVTAEVREEGESSQAMSSVAFIFTAVKPWALRASLWTVSFEVVCLLLILVFGVWVKRFDVRLHFHVVWTIASDPRIYFELIPYLPAEKLVDRNVEFSRFEIPQSNVDSCQCAHKDGAAAVETGAP